METAKEQGIHVRPRGAHLRQSPNLSEGPTRSKVTALAGVEVPQLAHRTLAKEEKRQSLACSVPSIALHDAGPTRKWVPRSLSVHSSLCLGKSCKSSLEPYINGQMRVIWTSTAANLSYHQHECHCVQNILNFMK